MRGIVPDIRARESALVAIGSGSAEQAREFRQQQSIEFPLLLDPDLEAFAAAGLRRGVQTVARWGVLKSGLRAWRGGHRQGKTQGDPWQQGGVFVVDAGGHVSFAHISSEAGDHPAPEAILEALDQLRDG